MTDRSLAKNSTHFHKCPEGHLWMHKDIKRTEGEQIRAHTCPECGSHDPVCSLKYRPTEPELELFSRRTDSTKRFQGGKA